MNNSVPFFLSFTDLFLSFFSVSCDLISLRENKVEPSRGGESMSASSNTNDEDDPKSFGCNICLELAREPIVTLCGHLFCWPCLYKWLHLHSQSNHCPVCKSLVKEETLVPLYGMGNRKPSSDPRSKPINGVTVPNRPSASRIETSRPLYGQRHHGSSFIGGYSGFASIPSGTRFGNFLL